MTAIVAAFVFLAVPAGPAEARGEVTSMEAYLWQNRPVLVFAPDADHPLIAAQRAVLAGEAAGLADREIVVIEIVAGRVTVDGRPAPGLAGDALRKRYSVRDDEAVALLVGKDGGVKIRQERALTAEALYPTIDAMPMRRQEMRARGQ